MKLNFDINFKDLYSLQGLNKVHKEFTKYIETEFEINYEIPDNSEELIVLAQLMESFIIKLFFIEEEGEELKNLDVALKIIHECKRKFIQRSLPNNCTEKIEILTNKLKELLHSKTINELHYAQSVLIWLKDDIRNAQKLDIAGQYAKYMVDLDDDNKSILFKIPKKIEFSSLINVKRKCINHDIGQFKLANTVTALKTHEREGFTLQSNSLSMEEASDNAHYCLFCHERNKDSCRTGTWNKVFSQKMSGCPLDQKISEMNYLKSKGFNIAALSIIIIDNPMCAATGHRICNDCSKACIFQKQEPVNIPGIETNILDAVLRLPYGFEIYSLLTKWNPLGPLVVPKNFTGYNVLVSGMGPAGFTMAHYLVNEGHTVVGIDGTKIEMLPTEISGLLSNNRKTLFKPVKNVQDIYESLDERTIWGFGGVSEYGITVRWNKNYLKLIRIILERRDNFRLYGGIRFGSNISFHNFYSLNFHHLVLAVGAGSPKIPNITNVIARGVRFASDFLMTLQLGGAFKKDSLTNLQLRMPIVVIGGGLTAIDVATEALEYYKLQVEKFELRYTRVLLHFGSCHLDEFLDEENKEIINEFLLHAKELKAARSKLEYLKSLGGVKIIYYKNFEESTSYRQNHEEVKEALKQGIEFVENVNPVEFICDKYGSLSAVRTKDLYQNEYIIAAKSAIIAVGNTPNFFIDDLGKNSKENDVTLIGDIDSKYSGSVVKAMASAKNSYKEVTKKLFQNKIPINSGEQKNTNHEIFFNTIDLLFKAQVLEVKEIAKNIIEVILHAPLAAQNFEPGQFYKLQNYETNSTSLYIIEDRMTSKPNYLMEPIALTGASVDKIQGKISLIILEYGASSRLSRYLKPGEYVSLMGPVGEATEIQQNENVLLLGGGLGNAVLFSIGVKMRSMGCNVTYIAGYKSTSSIFKIKEIEKASDLLIWACEEKLNMPIRKGDKIFHGNIIQALTFNAHKINLHKIDRIITIGSDQMMHSIQQTLSYKLKNMLKPSCKLIASINSPMQCMMKGLCAQCLQKHYLNDSKESFIYSCKTQDQNLLTVDFSSLNDRLKQNHLSEIITNLWVCTIK